MIYTAKRAKRTEVLNLLVEAGLEWRRAMSLDRSFAASNRAYGYIYQQGGSLVLSGPVSMPDDDQDALCDKEHRRLRWWGDYIQSIVYRLNFGELPIGHKLDFGMSDEGHPS